MSAIRVAGHVHSSSSYDGSWTLAELAAGFARRGYDAILMAEHDRGFDESRWRAYREACARASTAKIVIVPGIEYSDPANTVHIPVWGDLPFLGAGLPTAQLLTEVRRLRGVAVLAHPARRRAHGLLSPDLLDALSGVEIWNRKYDGYAPSREGVELLAVRPGLIPFVGLDFHTARQFHPLAMMLTVAGPVTAETVWAALADRRAQPTAFGLDALRLTHGPAAPAARSLEYGRRRAARGVRAVRRRRSQKTS